MQSAACCLVVVEQIEGASPAQQAALQLIQAALQAGQYGLAADLLRFMVPPGESGEALLTPASAGSGGGGAAPADAQQQQEPAPPAAPQQEEQQPAPQQEQQQGGGSWFWGLFGSGSAPAAPAPEAPAARPPTPPSAAALRQQQEEEEEAAAAAAGEAWRLTAAHAWKLLDSGALRCGAATGGGLAHAPECPALHAAGA